LTIRRLSRKKFIEAIPSREPAAPYGGATGLRLAQIPPENLIDAIPDQLIIRLKINLFAYILQICSG